MLLPAKVHIFIGKTSAPHLATLCGETGEGAIEGSVYLDDSVPVAGEVEEVGADGREATGEERLAVVA